MHCNIHKILDSSLKHNSSYKCLVYFWPFNVARTCWAGEKLNIGVKDPHNMASPANHILLTRKATHLVGNLT